jgi:predicted ester cyclase
LGSPSALLEEEVYNIISKNLISIPTPPPGEGAVGMFNSVKYFGQVIFNLSWQPQEILQDANKYTVRSLVKGTPNGLFFTVETATGKTFETMSIDILTVEDGKVVHSYHLEDWTTAISQLTSK